MLGLTLVIPVFNVRDYLIECLKSLPDAYDVILVNDGSTDGSDQICRDFARDRKNVVVVDKPNGGLSDARNAGIQYVETEYVFYLDADDYIDRQSLTDAFDFACENQLDWVQCGYVYDYGDTLLKPNHHLLPRIEQKSNVMKDLVNNGYIRNFAWGKIYKTEIARKFKFPTGKFYEDSFWQYLVVHHSEKFGVYPSVVTYYRQRSTSISGQFSLRNLDLLEGLAHRLEFLIHNHMEYPGLSMPAAVNLWLEAEYLSERAAAMSDSDANNLYGSRLQDIRRKYSRWIEAGIGKSPVPYRLAYECRYTQNRVLSKLSTFLLRVYNRLHPAKYYNLIKK